VVMRHLCCVVMHIMLHNVLYRSKLWFVVPTKCQQTRCQYCNQCACHSLLTGCPLLQRRYLLLVPKCVSEYVL